jgi:hypothetical protein
MGMISSPTRQAINLNGIWEARKEGEQIWKQVLVPGAYDFEGEVEFKRSFQLDTSLVGQTFKLFAYGINARSKIYINGNYLGGHDGGYTPFSLDFETQYLNFKDKNEIRIVVDNKLNARTSLPLKHRPRLAYNYGGIFRDIFIVALPSISIETLQVQTNFRPDFKNPQILVSATLRNKIKQVENYDKENIALQVELWDSVEEKLVYRSPEESIYFDTVLLKKEVTFTVNETELWSPDHPKLYRLRAYVIQGTRVLDEYSMRIGLSDIKVDGKNLVLNGKPLLLRGIDWYEDYPDLGPTAGWEEIKAEVIKIKELGANSIRVVGTPPHPFLLNILDELGILVFLEVPLYSVPGNRFRDPAFTQRVRGYYQEILESSASHVSVAGWGFGSDLQFTKASTKDFLQNLKQEIQKYSARPTFSVFHNQREIFWPNTVDLVFLDCFDQAPKKILTLGQQWNARYPNKPVIFSIGYPLLGWNNEMSSFKITQNNRTLESSKDDRFIEMEEVQADQIQRAILTLRPLPDLAGIFVKSFTDWSEARPNLIVGPTDVPFINRSGIVGRNGAKRLAYEVVHSEFRGDKPPAISSRVKPQQNPIVYPVAGLALVLIFLFNFNRSRRLRKNLRRIFVHPHGFYTEIRENRKVPAWHTFLLSFLTCVILGVMLSSLAFLLKQNLLFDEILNLFVANDSLKVKLIWLIWEPPWFILIVTGLLFLLFTVFAFLLKITAFALSRPLPTSQYFTMTSWASANFIWLLPIVPIYYRILINPHWVIPAFWTLVLFLAWFGVRMFRGIKVLYSLSYTQMGLVVFFFCLLIFGGLAWYYDRNQALFDYWPYYWNLIVR